MLLGFEDGLSEGCNDRLLLGCKDGASEGIILIDELGDKLGALDGLEVGGKLGIVVGECGEGVGCAHDAKDSAIVNILHVLPNDLSATMDSSWSKRMSLAQDIRHKHLSGSSLLWHQRFWMTTLSISCCPFRSICQKALPSSVCANVSSLLSMAFDAANLDLFR